MHVAIAGNIGAGKTTLTKLLAKHYNWKPHFESVDENPYLDDFYGEMERWSFNLQVFFLNSRFRQILDRTFILKKLWGDDDFFNARSMDVFISKLRKKLQNDSSVKIINVRGFGYKLTF